MLDSSSFTRLKFDRLTERLASKYLNKTGQIKVLGYTNTYLITDRINTRIHINHFLSGIYGDYRESISVLAEFYDSSGKKIFSKRQRIAPEGFAILNVKELLNPREMAYGTVVCHVEVDPYLRKFFRDRGVSQLGSYFFVTWSEDESAIACSHAIEAYKGAFFEIPSWAKLFVKPPGQLGDSWISNKVINPHNLEHILILVNNPGSQEITTRFSLFAGDAESESQSLIINPLGTKLIEVSRQSILNTKIPLTVNFSNLATGNSKPYIFLKYKSTSGYVAHHL